MEKKWDRMLIKRKNTSSEMPENNLFENYFGERTVKRINELVDGSRPFAIQSKPDLEQSIQPGLHDAISDLESRYR